MNKWLRMFIMQLPQWLRIFIMNQYSFWWFYWKKLTSNKRYTLVIDIARDEVMDRDFCTFCENQLRACLCFSDIVQLFKDRQDEIAFKIAQPIFDKANGEEK